MTWFKILACFAYLLALKFFLVWYEVKIKTWQDWIEDKYGYLNWRFGLSLALNIVALMTILVVSIALLIGMTN